jgi:hypothetical protein
MNLHAYSNNDPVNNSDVIGLWGFALGGNLGVAWGGGAEASGGIYVDVSAASLGDVFHFYGSYGVGVSPALTILPSAGVSLQGTIESREAFFGDGVEAGVDNIGPAGGGALWSDGKLAGGFLSIGGSTPTAKPGAHVFSTKTYDLNDWLSTTYDQVTGQQQFLWPGLRPVSSYAQPSPCP